MRQQKKAEKHEQRQKVMAWVILAITFICIVSYGVTNYVWALK